MSERVGPYSAPPGPMSYAPAAAAAASAGAAGAAPQQQQLSKINFKVVSCSSFDPEHSYTELETHTSQTKGWYSKKYVVKP